MYGIITVFASTLIAIVGILQGNAAKQEDRAFFGLTRIGAFLMVLAIVGGVVGTLSAIDEYKTERNPIVVSPVESPIHAGAFDTRIPFEVHNRGDETIYSAWVKISTKNPNFKNIQIALTSADGRKFVKPEGGELFNADILLMPVIDKDMLPAFFLLFRSLSAEETSKFLIKVESPSNAKENQSLTLRFSVIDYKHEPYWIGVQNDAVAFKFQIPEGFTMQKGIWPFLMIEKKNSGS